MVQGSVRQDGAEVLRRIEMKTKSTSKLKKELDKLFSLYIRQKYSENGYATCYTCGITKPWKEMQCGHFVSRSYLATRFLEANVRVQCVGCNMFGGGRTVIFANKIENEEGLGTVAALYKEAQKVIKNFPYQEKIEYYKQKIKELN